MKTKSCYHIIKILYSRKEEDKMARLHSFPDPDDMSKNNPGIIVNSNQVLGIYNRFHDDDDAMQKVTQKVQEWFVKEAKSQGWDKAEFLGSQCILKNTRVENT